MQERTSQMWPVCEIYIASRVVTFVLIEGLKSFVERYQHESNRVTQSAGSGYVVFKAR